MKLKVIFSIPQELGSTKVLIIREDFSTVQMEFPEPWIFGNTQKRSETLEDTGDRFTYTMWLGKDTKEPAVGDIQDGEHPLIRRRRRKYTDYKQQIVDIQTAPDPYFNKMDYKITCAVLGVITSFAPLPREEDEFIKYANEFGWDTSDPIWEASNRRNVSYEDFLKKAVEDLFEEEVIDVIQL